VGVKAISGNWHIPPVPAGICRRPQQVCEPANQRGTRPDVGAWPNGGRENQRPQRQETGMLSKPFEIL